MAHFNVTFKVDMPYPKEFEYRAVKAGNLGTAIARAWRLMRKDLPRKQIRGAVRVVAIRI